ncbi:hypothetical protein B0I37DRAFT_409564 [Chaetomium sp. MPI-CAGE-AT-0009]|nr:hypothetical protein B0I37DRAFT_409564 [Chaetomium sp. MPI-CAGE-AT-0009]
MYRCAVVWLLAAGDALVAAVPVAGQQKPLGRLAQMSGVTRQYMSCRETYGEGWRTCGSWTSRSCYSPDLGHSCCNVDNNYCEAGTWCAPVAGYCCLDTEDLETCARNAGFELPGLEILESLAATAPRESTISGTRPDI